MGIETTRLIRILSIQARKKAGVNPRLIAVNTNEIATDMVRETRKERTSVAPKRFNIFSTSSTQ